MAPIKCESRPRRPLRFCGANCAAGEAAENLYTGEMTRNQEKTEALSQPVWGSLGAEPLNLFLECSKFGSKRPFDRDVYMVPRHDRSSERFLGPRFVDVLDGPLTRVSQSLNSHD